MIIPIQFVEPSLNADGSPLSDLSHLNFYHSVNAGPEVKSANIPALAPTGGQMRTFDLNITLPAGNSTVTIAMTATDLVGNESVRSNVVTRVFTDTVAPAAPVLL